MIRNKERIVSYTIVRYRNRLSLIDAIVVSISKKLGEHILHWRCSKLEEASWELLAHTTCKSRWSKYLPVRSNKKYYLIVTRRLREIIRQIIVLLKPHCFSRFFHQALYSSNLDPSCPFLINLDFQKAAPLISWLNWRNKFESGNESKKAYLSMTLDVKIEERYQLNARKLLLRLVAWIRLESGLLTFYNITM